MKIDSFFFNIFFFIYFQGHKILNVHKLFPLALKECGDAYIHDFFLCVTSDFVYPLPFPFKLCIKHKMVTVMTSLKS